MFVADRCHGMCVDGEGTQSTMLYEVAVREMVDLTRVSNCMPEPQATRHTILVTKAHVATQTGLPNKVRFSERSETQR